MLSAADGNRFGSISRKYEKQQRILKKVVRMRGHISEQICSSFLHSKVFGSCCVWLDNSELFKASHAKSNYYLL